MARAFDGSSQSLQSAATLSTINGAGRIAISFWLYTTFTGDDDMIMELSANSNSNAGAFKILGSESGAGLFWVDALGDVGKVEGRVGTDPSDNTWHHILVQIDFTKSVAFAEQEIDSIYFDGVAATLTRESPTVNNTGTFGDYTLNVMSRNNAGLFADGRMAELAFYTPSSLLTAEDAVSLAAGYSPLMVRSGELVNYWPLLGRTSPEIDLVGGIGLTVNSATVVEHPRIIYPSRSGLVVPDPSGAVGAVAPGAVTVTASAGTLVLGTYVTPGAVTVSATPGTVTVTAGSAVGVTGPTVTTSAGTLVITNTGAVSPSATSVSAHAGSVVISASSYTPYVWQNDPGGGTPIMAARLNIIENGIGSNDARLSLLESGTTFPVLPTFNVEDYGAVGDGVTDDTAAFEDAWNALLANGEGLLYLPRAVTYLVSADTLLARSSDGCYAMFPIPQIASNTSTPKKTIGILGVGDPTPCRVWAGIGNQAAALATSSVIEVTYATAKTWHATYGHPSVFGAPDTDKAASFTSVTNVHFVADRVMIRQPPNPSMCNLNLETVSTCAIGTYGADCTGNPDETPEPTNTTGSGIMLPRSNNHVAVRADAVTVWGYYAGIGPVEHCDIRTMISVRCKIGMPFRRGFGHPGKIGHVTIEQCPWGLAGYDPSVEPAVVDIPSYEGQPIIKVEFLDWEDYDDGTNHWTYTRYPSSPRAHIVDRNNVLRGYVSGYVAINSANGSAPRTSDLYCTGQGGQITDFQMRSLLDNTNRAKADFLPGGTPEGPPDPPDTPTIGSATAGHSSATVSFTPAATGETATSFTAVSTPSSITGTGGSSPIIVSGLSNGTGYTFKVYASNSGGDSSQSAASNSVTPTAPSTLAADTFTRADSSSSLGTSSHGETWTQNDAFLGISTNKAYCSTASVSYHRGWLDATEADATVSADITTDGTSSFEVGLVAHVVDVDNMYMLSISNNGTFTRSMSLYRRLSGTWTQLGSTQIVTVGGGTVTTSASITCSGSAIAATYGSGSINTTDNSFPSATNYGIMFTVTGTTRIDNFLVVE